MLNSCYGVHVIVSARTMVEHGGCQDRGWVSGITKTGVGKTGVELDLEQKLNPHIGQPLSW